MNSKSISSLLKDAEKQFTINEHDQAMILSKAKRIANAIINTEHPDNIYFQGSFSIGTVVKPYSKDSDLEYDVDLVVRDDSVKNQTTSQKVKKDLGDAIRKSTLKYPYHEGKRCWTLEYGDPSKPFHVDLLPCVSEHPEKPGSTAIAITDTDSDHREYRWKSSNPLGFRMWFQQVDEKHSARKYKDEVDRLRSEPDLKDDLEDMDCTMVLRTPMRAAVKVLKRHRYVFFADRDDSEFSPASIMITTIVASIVNDSGKSYSDVWALLCDVIPRMSSVVSDVNGHYVLKNPVDSKENFVDRWAGEPRYRAAFNAWVSELKSWMNIIKNSDDSSICRFLEKTLGLGNGTLTVPNHIAKKMDTSTAPKSYLP